MRISDCSSDVCSSDLADNCSGKRLRRLGRTLLEIAGVDHVLGPWLIAEGGGIDDGADRHGTGGDQHLHALLLRRALRIGFGRVAAGEHAARDKGGDRSEERTYELQALMRIPYADF